MRVKPKHEAKFKFALQPGLPSHEARKIIPAKMRDLGVKARGVWYDAKTGQAGAK